jgi:retron-type reverse transcriptase
VASPLLRKVRSKRNLERAWRVIQNNARVSKSEEVRREVEKFQEDPTGKLEVLYRQLLKGTFTFPPARGIPLPKGGRKRKRDRTAIRPIVLASLESRIVQRAILNFLLDVVALQPYVNNPYSFGGLRKAEGQDLAAVPAAIAAVLDAIANGARFVVCADISSFFTLIPKSAVSRIVAEAVHDPTFMALFDSAIHVELSNMANLREHAAQFPTEDIGVAQGNSLSPLLGNILLHHFDRHMNTGDCRCLRYIDDFIILAPTRRATVARLRQAVDLLATYGMRLSAAKTMAEPIPVTSRFEFLGIELANGLIRPSRKAQLRLLETLAGHLYKSRAAFHAARRDEGFDKFFSLLTTLKRVDDVVQGWGKHYRFCNDEALFQRLDDRVTELIRDYIGAHANARHRVDEKTARCMLGIEQLSAIERKPFAWPKAGTGALLKAAA